MLPPAEYKWGAIAPFAKLLWSLLTVGDPQVDEIYKTEMKCSNFNGNAIASVCCCYLRSALVHNFGQFIDDHVNTLHRRCLELFYLTLNNRLKCHVRREQTSSETATNNCSAFSQTLTRDEQWKSAVKNLINSQYKHTCINNVHALYIESPSLLRPSWNNVLNTQLPTLTVKT